jgi:Cu(I)/Ag(I) efflux system membrane protein CusA/SilA
MVDMGIVICENILKRLGEAGPDDNALEVVYQAAAEVGGAVLTAVSTTVVSFLPVFTMTGPEGKLFKPLAYTKTFALIASIVVALTIIPPAAHILFIRRVNLKKFKRYILGGILLVAAVISAFRLNWWIGGLIGAVGLYHLLKERVPKKIDSLLPLVANIVVVVLVGIILTGHWLPLGPAKGMIRNLVFVVLLIGGLLLFFKIFQIFYGRILVWCLAHKLLFLSIPIIFVLLGGTIWLGFERVFSFVPQQMRSNVFWSKAIHMFPGLGKEFMPDLDEGSFLYMPTTMPHASIGEALDVLQKQDTAFVSIPEIDSVVGKIGRVDSPLDPAPISMVETVINYKPEYIVDKDGHHVRFRYDKKTQEFVRDENGELIPDRDGRPFRQWRDHIHSPDDIWDEIVKAGQIPGSTSAPKLQPIAARIVMLQSGMRAPMGVKVRGPDLETIERVALDIERYLKEVPSVEPLTVSADRIVGKPYLEIDIDREAIARYGVSIAQVQDVIEVAIGGRRATTTVEGRERYAVRIRYMRELRDRMETLGEILVPSAEGAQIPLIQLAEIRYVRGPQAIKSEDTFLVGYVVFDKREGYAEVDVVEQCKQYLQEKTAAGEFSIPEGVNYAFSGTYENQIRAQKTLAVVIPLALLIIFIILYFQFHSAGTSLLVFSGILVAWSGGFLMIWLYAQPWFLDFDVFDVNMRVLFQIHPINLSVAIWVGFLALFGIASDDGVVMCTYLKQSFHGQNPESIEEIRQKVIEAGKRRIRPCLMTTATTILALTPVLTSTGRGSDIMVPMAIPSFGGMTIEILTMLVVPVLYCWFKEFRLHVRPST